MKAGSGVRMLLIGICLVMLAAVAAGLWMIGTPAHQRAARLDDVRVRALTLLTSHIEFYATRHDSLPTTLDALDVSLESKRDPVTGVAYEYRAKGTVAFELCAKFETAVGASGERIDYALPTSYAWAHAEGRQCFERTASLKASDVDGSNE